MQQTLHTHPLHPIYNSNSRILILGTFPSVISRKEQFYYSHPRNRFWDILYALFDIVESKEIKQDKCYKINFLKQHNIALWDIVKTCTINNSRDSTLNNITPNDIMLILSQVNIESIFCNGKKAYTLFQHFFANKIQDYNQNIKIFSLPSSSPANVNYNMERLIEAWKIMKNTIHYKNI